MAGMADDADGQDSAGAPALFELYRSQFGALVGFARLLADDIDPEEVVQEAFVRVLDRWSRVQDREHPGLYVRRTIVNLVHGRGRRLGSARRWLSRNSRVPVQVSAEAAALDASYRSAVVMAIRALPQRQRECVVLRYYADCTVPEIAATLGISVGAVKSHLHRAIAAVRPALEGIR